ncbi:hypothetical protein [Clostridium ihumii]|uniref:hypothetical protein n=1 Tax=Clostridium ihumii TaxID=1470356 RepID=UPI003D32E41A
MFILIGIAIVSRYIYINNKYPSPIVEEHKLNEAVEYNGVKITAKEFKILNDKELEKMNLPDNTFSKEYDEGKMKVLLVKLNVKNDSNEVKNIESYMFSISTLQWCTGPDMKVFNVINGDNSTMNLNLKPGEEATNDYPYVIVADSFNDKFWSNLENEKFKLVLNLYPINKSINLN